MNKTQIKDTVSNLNNSLGDYQLEEYHERIYSTIYYQLRNEIGWIKKNQFERDNKPFSWDDFKQKYEATFGSCASKETPLEILLEFAQSKLGKNLNDLIVDNKISWSKRQPYLDNNSSNNIEQ